MRDELTLNINKFNRPDIKQDADADALRILRCILKRKSNPLFGNLEFNISKYRFEDIDELATSLASDIHNHLERVLPDIVIHDVDVKKLNHNTVGIGIMITGKTENSRKQYLFQLQKPDGVKDLKLKDIIKI